MKPIRWGILAVAALGLLMALGPQAKAADDQNQPPARPRRQTVEDRIKRLTETLNLTQEQQDKLKTVFQDENKKRRDLRQDTGLSAEERRDKNRAIREETAKQIKAILSADQWEKYQKFLQQNRPRRGQQQSPPGN